MRSQKPALPNKDERVSREIVQIEKAAGELVDELVKEKLIMPETEEKAVSKVSEIILRIQHNSAIVRGFFVSPFAPHSEQVKYEELCPGVTDRQMSVFEKRMDTRNFCDKTRAICIPIGMLLSFSVIVYGMWGGFALIREGKITEGLTSIFGSLAVLGGIFAFNKWFGKREDKDNSSDW